MVLRAKRVEEGYCYFRVNMCVFAAIDVLLPLIVNA